GLDWIQGEPQGIAAADYDADGRIDLLITLRDGVALMRNLGGGRFANLTRDAGLAIHGWTTSAAFADVDGDGWLDLYVGRYVNFGPGMPEFERVGDAWLTLGPDAYEAQCGALYKNLGNGKFREVTKEAGLADSH